MNEPATEEEVLENGARPVDVASVDPMTEYRIYRVTRLAASTRGSGPYTLRPPFAEHLTEEQEAKVEAAQATVEGLVYSFAKVGISRDIPVTESEVRDLRARGWAVSSGRLPRGSERAIVDSLIRRHLGALDRRRQRQAREQEEWRIMTSTLYVPRIRRKVPWDRYPQEWLEVKLDYELQHLDHERKRSGRQDRGLNREKPMVTPDLNEVQRIVCGWEKHPGVEIWDHRAWFDPERREHLEKALAKLPDSPVGIAGVLKVCGPVAEPLLALARILDTEPIHWLLDRDEEVVFSRVCSRAKALAAELEGARESLERLGWKIDEEGKLCSIPGEPGGQSGEYLNRVIRELYSSLHPIYVRAFGDPTKNPEALRRQVREILLPFFDPAGLDTGRKRRIWNQFNRAKHRGKQTRPKSSLKSHGSKGRGVRRSGLKSGELTASPMKSAT